MNPEEKKKEIRELKENSDLVKFVKSLTKEELQIIDNFRRFDKLKPGTMSYKVALNCDQLRQNRRKILLNLNKRLWSIDDLTNNINRLKKQLLSGTITEKIPNGLDIMNESELNSLIKHNEWLRDGEFYSLYPLLSDYLSIVNHIDINRNVIISSSEFDKYVQYIIDYVKKYGYDLFGEVK